MMNKYLKRNTNIVLFFKGGMFGGMFFDTYINL